MATPRSNPEPGSTERKPKSVQASPRVRKTESDAIAEMSPGDRVNYINRNMDRLAPKTRAKLDAYQAEGHAGLVRQNLSGLSAEEVRARLLSGK